MNSTSLLYSSLKPKAIALRQQGKTFSEIQRRLGSDIPKSTLSYWLKQVELTSEHTERIKKIVIASGQYGRQIGAWKNREVRVKRLQTLREQAEKEYPIHVKDPAFTAGLILYLAEGSKKSEQFQFMNSDPYLIKIMIQWILKVSDFNFGDISFRLYIHELYAHENCETFWIEVLNAQPEQFKKTIYKPTGREYKKNPNYKGCLRIEIRGSDLYWKTLAWRDCLYSSLG